MESEAENKPKYSGYGYHGGGRKKTGRIKQFQTTSVSGTPEEIALLKSKAESAGKSISRYVLDLIMSQ